MARDMTSGLGVWIWWRPDFKGNRDPKLKDPILFEIQILTHPMLKKWRMGHKIAEAQDGFDEFEHDDLLIRQHMRGVKGLKHNKKLIANNLELLEVAASWMISAIKTRILLGIALTKAESKN